jgi:hypothetical protein
MKKYLSCVFAVMLMASCAASTPSGGDTGGGVAPAASNAQYIVLAWNDLGMHCLNPTYDSAVILPPFNTVQAQVVQRGEKPQLVDAASGISVQFKLVNNSSSSNKRSYGQFWTNLQALFGVTRPNDVGVGGLFGFTDQGLTGTMDWDAAAGTFRAEGIPVVPVDDSGAWSPYQQVIVTVKDQGGATIAETKAMVPTSDEIDCAKCHAPGGTVKQTFDDILVKHDAAAGTSLRSSEPVLCASCHGSPVLGATNQGSSGVYLSKAVHGFHSAVASPPDCYDCHPGVLTKCSRSMAHSTGTVSCTSCHGDLANVAASIGAGRTPWVKEPKCGDCHASSGAATLTAVNAGSTSTIPEVDTGTALYRNAAGHGGLACAACHSSPHAMVPSREAKDNYQAVAYQGKAVTIGSCGACHSTSKGQGSGEFMETHGGSTPEEWSACGVCHTAVPSANTDVWPHKYGWRAR